MPSPILATYSHPVHIGLSCMHSSCALAGALDKARRPPEYACVPTPPGASASGGCLHQLDREAWIAEAARLDRIGDRVGRKVALAHARAATMAVLASEVGK